MIVTLRDVTYADAERIWRWRNDPETRRKSFDSREISLDEHQQWFEATMQRQDRQLYIAQVHSSGLN